MRERCRGKSLKEQYHIMYCFRLKRWAAVLGTCATFSATIWNTADVLYTAGHCFWCPDIVLCCLKSCRSFHNTHFFSYCRKLATIFFRDPDNAAKFEKSATTRKLLRASSSADRVSRRKKSLRSNILACETQICRRVGTSGGCIASFLLFKFINK